METRETDADADADAGQQRRKELAEMALTLRRIKEEGGWWAITHRVLLLFGVLAWCIRPTCEAQREPASSACPQAESPPCPVCVQQGRP